MKIFLLIILLLIPFSIFSQICPEPIVTTTFSIQKPVHDNQLIGTFYVCDPEDDQVIWNISNGNTDNLWNIDNGIITVNDANKINIDNNESYLITVRVTDNGIPSDRKSVV